MKHRQPYPIPKADRVKLFVAVAGMSTVACTLAALFGAALGK